MYVNVSNIVVKQLPQPRSSPLNSCCHCRLAHRSASPRARWASSPQPPSSVRSSRAGQCLQTVVVCPATAGCRQEVGNREGGDQRMHHSVFWCASPNMARGHMEFIWGRGLRPPERPLATCPPPLVPVQKITNLLEPALSLEPVQVLKRWDWGQRASYKRLKCKEPRACPRLEDCSICHRHRNILGWCYLSLLSSLFFSLLSSPSYRYFWKELLLPMLFTFSKFKSALL